MRQRWFGIASGRLVAAGVVTVASILAVTPSAIGGAEVTGSAVATRDDALALTECDLDATACLVRPGALVRTATGACTLGFLLLGPGGERYASTAGHCVLSGADVLGGVPEPSERTWDAACTGDGHCGPWAADRAHAQIGRFVYAAVDQPAGLDFALIRLDGPAAASASPAAAFLGGPVGPFGPGDQHARRLDFVGNGLAPGTRLPSQVSARAPASESPLLAARSVVAPSTDENPIRAYGTVASGDSGGPVLDDELRAVGLVSFAAVGTSGTVGIARLDLGIARAASVLGIALALWTEPEPEVAP